MIKMLLTVIYLKTPIVCVLKSMDVIKILISISAGIIDIQMRSKYCITEEITH